MGNMSQVKRLSYSKLQGIWVFVQNKGCSQKISFSYAVNSYIHMLNVDRFSKD